MRRCSICGASIDHRRTSAKTCSDKCRAKLNRREKPEETVVKLYDMAHDGIMGLVMHSGSLDPAIAFKASRRLQAVIIEALNYAPEDVQKRIYEQLRDSATG